ASLDKSLTIYSEFRYLGQPALRFSAYATIERASIGSGVYGRSGSGGLTREIQLERRSVMMRNVWKCALGLLMGAGVLAGNATAQFKNGSQATELNIPRLS